MKAHIRPQKPVALVWQPEESLPQWAALAAACQKAGLTVKKIEKEALPLCVGQLCDLPGKYQPAAEAAAERFAPALILSGLSDRALDRLLSDLKSAQVNIPLKAVVTPTSKQWPLQQLLAELTQEHAAFNPQ